MVDRKLGRGLDFFLSGGRTQPAQAAPAAEPAEETLLIGLAKLGPSPNQPRSPIDEADLAELAASIRASGILQPILARRVGDRFEIVAGERRWRAAKLAGLERVPVLIRKVTDDESAVFGLVENLQREDLDPIEKALAFKKLQDRFQCSQDDIAKRVGFERSTVTNFLRLLDLPPEIQAHVSRGTLSMGHARALLGLADASARVAMADQVVRDAMSVRQVEALVKEANLGPAVKAGAAATVAAPGKPRPVWLNELEENLVESLGTSVRVRYGKKRSQIIIECAGREEFERIYNRLKG